MKVKVKKLKPPKLKIKQSLRSNKANWVMDDDDILGLTYWCSFCGCQVEEKTRYCPDCGRKMKDN